MRAALKVLLVGALLATGAVQANAQSITNIVQNLVIKLTGYYQTEPTDTANGVNRHTAKVSIKNPDILNLLGEQLQVSFSDDAKLMLVSEAPADLEPRVIVRDIVSGVTIDTDVSAYFSALVLASAEESKIQNDPLKASGTGYDAMEFQMALDKATFKIVGFSKTKVQTLKYQGNPAAVYHAGTFNVSGSGYYALTPTGGLVLVVLSGTVQISGHDVEVTP
jgi:hypothetical protein